MLVCEVLTRSCTDFYEWTRRDGLVVARGTFYQVTTKANDELRFTIQMTSATSTILTLSKNSGEQVQQIPLNVALGDICLKSPGWFVRAEGSRPLLNFEDVSFDGARATFNNGTSIGPQAEGSTVVDIERDGTVFTETGLGEQSVSIRYTQ